jgi:hypothetical protein
MIAVNYDDLSRAVDFVSAGGMDAHAYIDLDTGTIHWVGDGVEEEAPEDVEDNDRFLPIPHKRDLDLGSTLVMDFATREVPHLHDRIRDIFRRRGAYARFKDLLASNGVLEKWYAFEAEETERALREWCADHGIAVVMTFG